MISILRIYLYTTVYFAISSCQLQALRQTRKHQNTQISYSNASEYNKTSKVLDYIYTRANKEHRHGLKSLVQFIDINKQNCTHSQVACTFPDKKGMIFITPLFFDLSIEEQVGTIIHEAYHHKYGYQHTNCKSKQISNTDCDKTMVSPFGEELKFYFTLPNSKLRQELIYKTKVRINQLL